MIKSISSLLSGLLAVALITYLLTLTHPYCEDSIVKQIFTATVLFGQWLVFGGILCSLIPKHKFIFVSLFAVTGLPIMAAIWVVSLWPPSIFGFAWIPFYMTFPEGYLLTIPLILIGIALSSFHRRRIMKTEQDAAANP